MNFPLPIRSLTPSMEYFTPLHVDTNIEYCLDMEKFPEINNTSHHCEPALIIATNNCVPSDLSDMELTSFSEDGDISLDVTEEDIHDLIETLEVDDFELDAYGTVTGPPSGKVHHHHMSSTGKEFPCVLDTASCHSLCESHLDTETRVASDYQESVNFRKRKRSILQMLDSVPLTMDCIKRKKLDLSQSQICSSNFWNTDDLRENFCMKRFTSESCMLIEELVNSGLFTNQLMTNHEDVDGNWNLHC